jgi:dCTP deaminase
VAVEQLPLAIELIEAEVILSGSDIRIAVEMGDIVLDPYHAEDINPNSYNYHLGSELYAPTVSESAVRFVPIKFGSDGFEMTPGTMYLGHTKETIGSSKYAMSLIGRSSLGRLGLYLQVSANLGHTGSVHQWTLELVAVKRLRIYPAMTIGQVTFWVNSGEASLYNGVYGKFDVPTPSFVAEKY